MTTRTKKIMTLMLSLMLVLTFSVTAFADNISIQLDGQNVQLGDVTPVTKDYRNYVPFRTVFEAMGADVDWDQASSTITAQRDGVTVEFVVGDKNFNVTKDGKTETIATDAASFLQNDYTYVPVRFAAQSLGANVGWDEDAQTVIIVDTPKLAAKYDSKFTIMDKYLAYSNKFAKDPYKVDGKLSADVKVTAEGETVPLTMEGTLSGLTYGTDAEMDMTLNLNMDKLIAMLEKEDPEAVKDPEFKAMVDQLKDMKVKAIANLSDGKMYMSMPMLNTMFGKQATDNVWFSMDYTKMMDQMGMGTMWDALLGAAKSDTDTTDLISLLVGFMEFDDVKDYSELQQVLDLVETFAGDGAFTKDDNGYTAKFQKTIEGVEISFNFVLGTNSKDEVTSYTLDMEAKDSNVKMSMAAAMDANNKATAKVSMEISDTDISMLINMLMDMEYSQTTNKPATAPEAGATIIDMMDVATNAPAGAAE